MNRFLTVMLILLISRVAYGQNNDSLYHTLIAKKDLLHLQKDYKKAITYYERAFEIHKPSALEAYKVAGAYSLDSNSLKAFRYLNFSLSSGWTEADWLSFDPYFAYLRGKYPHKWKEVLKDAYLKEKTYEQNLKRPTLRKRINMLTLNDQRLRYNRVQATDKKEADSINEQINLSDNKNLEEAKIIFSQYGWPKISDIGKDGQNNFWLIVQHADRDVFFQQAALSAMEKLKGTSELNLDNYAFLYDRVQCNLNYKQLYGTQVIWANNGTATGFRPIIKEDLVDKRRMELGLTPLSIYSLSYGFEYHKINEYEAAENDLADLSSTKTLIDSANIFYTKKDFNKTYDFYNNASAIQGGMSSNDNYEAAILFSKIYSQNKETKYRDIALDFLNLLFQRQELNRARLNKQVEFKVLQSDQRWIEIYTKLS